MDIIAVIISGIALLISMINIFCDSQYRRRQSTLDAFTILQSEVFDKLNQLSPAEIQEIVKDNKSHEYKILSGYIARLEHFCVGVNKNIYDKMTVYELAYGYLDGSQLLSRINPVIERKQVKANEDYYHNIHEMISWMQKTAKRKVKIR